MVALAFALCLGMTGTAMADTSTSTHYMVNETQFGSGSSLHDCSQNYCAKTSAGDTAVGSARSDNYSAQFGANTTDEPLLEIIVEGGDHDMGVLDSDHTGTAVSTIKVRNYLTGGYTLHIAGTHSLNRLTTPSTSHQGAEQFGINLANNTAPDIGANPVQVPDSTFAFGQVNSDYNQADLYMYDDGAAVAHSDKSSGETDYTLSLIINVSNITPGGRYTGRYSAIVVSEF
jgi:hypothetical protein